MNLASNLNTDALVGIPTLRTLSFKNNSFGGAIPFLTKFAGLRSVYLSINRFSGGVPDGLYFSRYQFSGLISSSLACSARFLKLRIDDNQFDGRIPNFWQPGLWLFAGNDDLCDVPLSYEYGSPRRSPGFIAGIILICIAVSLAAIGSSFIFRRSQKQHTDAGGALPTTQAAKIELVPANREEHASGRSGKKVPKEEQDQLAFVKEGKVKFNIQPVKFRLSLRHHADCKRMQCLEALHHLDEKEKKNCFPTVQIITTLIHGAGLAKNPHHARKLFDEMGERGLTPDRAAYNALVGAFVRADDLKSLLVIMDKMEKLDECERKKFQFKGSV
ncbi:pollen receptor-like kinase 2 [Zingiber officinale]|uniref:pollen receptor-like kinase 2 n=1 Tax=Zingiber officinale TaxID=94328 RepID=UPI001C4BA2EA|nr:pollen receptor-like kinase 2 [Zingiber officinale]